MRGTLNRRPLKVPEEMSHSGPWPLGGTSAQPGAEARERGGRDYYDYSYCYC